MGLGAPKRRSKLSHDPNNTAWSKSTTSFGHRILSSQGWQPGDYLGAENASHADHYTAANASHIRVLLREDNLGLGAKVGGKGNAETFGLSTLSGIFGRLNGKGDVEIEKQQSNLRDAELRSYQAQKYGFMNFVRGGLLVGDRIEDEPGKEAATKTVDGKSAFVGDAVGIGKKRKAEKDTADSVKEKRLKKKRESDVRAEDEPQPESPPSAVSKDAKKTPKKRKGGSEKSALDEHDPISTELTGSLATTADADGTEATKRRKRKQREGDEVPDHPHLVAPVDEKARLKQEKRARKEERRRRKEAKRLLKASKSVLATKDASTSATATGDPTALPTPVTCELPSDVTTPTQEGQSFGRRAIRQRYIQQKRMASMDPKALNEILMIKAAG